MPRYLLSVKEKIGFADRRFSFVLECDNPLEALEVMADCGIEGEIVGVEKKLAEYMRALERSRRDGNL